MKIAHDIDDVLVDCNAGINAFLSSKKGIYLKREDWHHFDLEEVTRHSLEEARTLYAEFNLSTYLEELPLINGSLEAISELAKSHTLIAITSRSDQLSKTT